MKRAFDLVFAVLGLMVFWPLLLVIAVSVFFTDGLPLFFRQERVGRHGRLFRIWKFRTMVRDAERRGALLTAGNDPRITPFGRLLRKTKLDELPQLFNVLTGEMSFVGPRPEVPHYVEQYTQQQRRVLELKPGITDIASIQYCHENEILGLALDPEAEYVRRIMPEKIRLNVEYAAHANLVTDFLVVARTVLRLVKAYRLPDGVEHSSASRETGMDASAWRRRRKAG